MTVLMEMIGLEPRFVAKPASGTVGFAFSSHLLGVPSVVGSSKVKQKDRHKTVLMEMIGLEPRFAAKTRLGGCRLRLFLAPARRLLGSRFK